MNNINKKSKIERLDILDFSKYSSQADWEASCWRKIITFQKIMEAIITPHERRDLVRRAAVAELLQEGKSYREIGRTLWLSPQTISVIKKGLNENNYCSYFERSKKERKRRDYSSLRQKKFDRPSGRVIRRTKYGTIYGWN